MSASAEGGHAEGAGLCYLLVCFKSRDFVSYLLASLYRPADTFLVHFDERSPRELKDYLQQVAGRFANIVVMTTQEYSWAGYSHVDLCLRAMTAGLASRQPWSHLIFLSEQHLPLKSPSAIQDRLHPNRSTAFFVRSTEMYPESQADIGNRFGAVYRELPGVGCFATGLAEREPDFFQTIYHGSNWLALCRDHCAYLVEAEKAGQFDLFKRIVHAEEMAIPTILARGALDIDPRDVTLVAAPHLVDNHSLVMTEDLFRWGESSDYLFIRKRNRDLTPYVDGRIRRQHFRDDVHRHDPTPVRAGFFGSKTVEDEKSDVARDVIERITKRLALRRSNQFDVRVVDPKTCEFPCRTHIVVRTPAMTAQQSIRILSQNGRDFKVCFVSQASHYLDFPRPYVRNGCLFSSVRVKVNDFFGYQEALPLDLEGNGFVSLRDGQGIDEIVAAVERLGADVDRYKPQKQAIDTGTHQMADQSNPRSARINRLVNLSGCRRYLEVGVAFGETFFDIDAPLKVAVDPNFQFDSRTRANPTTQFFPMTSDRFFEEYGGEPFDVIYLDGLHTYDQTSRDFLNSLRVAHDRTVWLLDDTVPNDADAALPSQAECYHRRAVDGNPDASWMGDVYKTVLLIDRVLPAFRYATFKGHGQTAVWRGALAKGPREGAPSLESIGDFSYDDLLGKSHLLNLQDDEQIYRSIQEDVFS